MSDTYCWIPPGALTSRAVSDLIDTIVAAWSERWFAAQRCAAGVVMQAGAGRPRVVPGDSQELWGESGAVSVQINARGRTLLADHALRRANGEIVAEDDQPLLAIFTHRIAEDLIGEIEAVIGFKAAANGDARLGAWVTVRDTKEQELLSVCFATDACRQIIRRAAGAPRPALALDHRTESLGEVRIPIEARAGAAVLGLQALAQLGPGDVIILDRTIEAGIELALVGGRVVACADLAIDAGIAEAKVTCRL